MISSSLEGRMEERELLRGRSRPLEEAARGPRRRRRSTEYKSQDALAGGADPPPPPFFPAVEVAQSYLLANRT